MSDRLDGQTENCIEDFKGLAIQFYRCNCIEQKCRHWERKERALTALRARIRELSGASQKGDRE